MSDYEDSEFDDDNDDFDDDDYDQDDFDADDDRDNGNEFETCGYCGGAGSMTGLLPFGRHGICGYCYGLGMMPRQKN
jgi:hypothetical protein